MNTRVIIFLQGGVFQSAVADAPVDVAIVDLDEAEEPNNQYGFDSVDVSNAFVEALIQEHKIAPSRV